MCDLKVTKKKKKKSVRYVSSLMVLCDKPVWRPLWWLLDLASSFTVAARSMWWSLDLCGSHYYGHRIYLLHPSQTRGAGRHYGGQLLASPMFFFFFFSIFNVLKKEIRIKSKHFSETLQLPNKFTNVTPPNNTFSNVAPTENISIFTFSKHQIKNTCQKFYQTNQIHKKKITVPNKSIVFFSFFYLLLEYPYMFFFSRYDALDFDHIFYLIMYCLNIFCKTKSN
jgi:hypothetical protein